MKPTLLFYFIICFFTCAAQDKNQFFALDENMNQTVLESSKYILWIHEKEDSNWQWDYYNTWGPMIKSNSYGDHDGTILNGRFCIYTTVGNLDSTGIFDHGKKNGSFYKYRSYNKDSIVPIRQNDYISDSLVKSINVTADKEKDKDTVNLKKAEYPSGISGWYKYLAHYLTYPDRAISKEVQGQVQVHFVVDTNGDITDLYIQKSVEYSLDQTTLELINKSGKWVPGMDHGLPVKSYKVQPVNFKLESQKF
ncbi:MAG TPA: energy transducer TonB [Puia sp.]